MRFLCGSQPFLRSLFAGLALASLCDTKVFLHRKGCSVPETPLHGLSQCQPPLCEEPLDTGVFKPGTLMEFYCQPGYALVGLPSLTICQGGEWHTVRELVCKAHGTPHPTSLIVATSVPFVVAVVLTFAALTVVATACVMLMTPTCSSCRCTEPANGAYEAMEDPEDMEHIDGEEPDNGEGPLPSYEEAVGAHLETSLLLAGHHSVPLDIASCHEPYGPSLGGLPCLRAPPSYQEALEETTLTEGRAVPEGEPPARLGTQHSCSDLGIENIC
ncbi:sushi domain-containing protein 4-like [Sceloporus undulatus]|uniref:sushi domain-containing protein 4-like n=1 Tax=Sceloporus undulatus TaxID=8520 RepID=UPI001C4B4D54|nr:sushi domain-containing protein 4-like [Sceloporus undulatus]